MLKGSCLCGQVQYEIKSMPRKVSHCHCRMCQKQHGAAFATYVSIPANDLEYTAGIESLSTYNSFASILRKFCKICGSNIEWSGSDSYPNWVSITLATIDSEYVPARIINIFEESRACWLDSLVVNEDKK